MNCVADGLFLVLAGVLGLFGGSCSILIKIDISTDFFTFFFSLLIWSLFFDFHEVRCFVQFIIDNRREIVNFFALLGLHGFSRCLLSRYFGGVRVCIWPESLLRNINAIVFAFFLLLYNIILLQLGFDILLARKHIGDPLGLGLSFLIVVNGALGDIALLNTLFSFSISFGLTLGGILISFGGILSLLGGLSCGFCNSGISITSGLGGKGGIEVGGKLNEELVFSHFFELEGRCGGNKGGDIVDVHGSDDSGFGEL